MALLEVSKIQKSFGKNEVLRGISFTLNKGDVLAIIGSSGSGKTTLLRCLNFLERPSGGRITVGSEVLFDSADPVTYDEKDIRKKRLHFGLVFQSFNLFPQYNVLQNIMLAPSLLLKEKGEYKANRARLLKETEETAYSLLEKVGLSEKAKAYPCELSGGQQQRVAIARALINSPEILLADEPTGNLDVHNSMEIMELLEEINRRGTTVLVVTHSREIVAEMGKRVITLTRGVLTGDQKGGIWHEN